jgi:hypothetical protein
MASRMAARVQSLATGQADAMAILIRRTLKRSNNVAPVSADGSTVCVLILRLNSSR